MSKKLVLPVGVEIDVKLNPKKKSRKSEVNFVQEMKGLKHHISIRRCQVILGKMRRSGIGVGGIVADSEVFDWSEDDLKYFLAQYQESYR